MLPVMKILQINIVCKSGSTGKIVYDMHTWFRDNGCESKIAYGRGSLLDDKDTYRFSPQYEVYAHAALTRLTGWTGCFSPIATRNLISFIESYSPDVVHLHSVSGYYVNDVKILSYFKKRGIHVVFTLHDECTYTGKCGYSYECDAWKTECGKTRCTELREYPASLLFDQTKKMYIRKKRIFQNFTNLQIVTPSKWLASRARLSFLGDKSITVVPNGIDTSVFRLRDTSELIKKYGNAKKVVHVTPNFNDRRKGGRYVLELAKRMPDVQFFIVGNREPIKCAPSNVYPIGRTENQEQLAQWYSFADVSVITSERENFPTVCLESLCCGTPVVGFDVGGTAETAPNGYGAFVKFGDMDALETVIHYALDGNLESKNECAKYGINQYSIERMISLYMDVYSMARGEN